MSAHQPSYEDPEAMYAQLNQVQRTTLALKLRAYAYSTRSREWAGNSAPYQACWWSRLTPARNSASSTWRGPAPRQSC